MWFLGAMMFCFVWIKIVEYRIGPTNYLIKAICGAKDNLISFIYFTYNLSFCKVSLCRVIFSSGLPLSLFAKAQRSFNIYSNFKTNFLVVWTERSIYLCANLTYLNYWFWSLLVITTCHLSSSRYSVYNRLWLKIDITQLKSNSLKVHMLQINTKKVS